MSAVNNGSAMDNKRKKENGESPSPVTKKFRFGVPAPAASSIQKSQGADAKRARIRQQRSSLPMAQARKRFLEEALKHPSVVLVGETGSGKTTQVPQFIHEARLDAEGAVAVTQPRRVAAVSVAARVAEEMEVRLGTLVGYRVRFEDATADCSKVIYQTDGMLLREAMLDPLLSRYSWVILDEAHERTVNTDILLGVVKSAQSARRQGGGPVLKVIVMSATLEAERFSSFFEPRAPVLFASGRQFPVSVRHASAHQSDWLTATLATVLQIHEEAPERHDALVFLTGQEEIDSAVKMLRQATAQSAGDDIPSHRKTPKMLVLPLYASLQPERQQKVFTPTPPGHRKVIVSTNLAETSLTIPGIKYVVDSCRVKAKSHYPNTGVDILKVELVSQAQALQRTGRAGREAEGHCYRMLTKAEFDRLPANVTPEIQRCGLSGVALQMLSLGIGDVGRFEFLDRPPEDAIRGALRLLRLLGAVDAADRLTDAGKKMAAFPLDPKFTKVLLSADELGCTEEIITIISLLSGESVLVNPASCKEQVKQARKKFAMSEGDHLTLLRFYRAYAKAGDQYEWCQQHSVHHRHMRFAVEVRKQLLELCRRNGIAVRGCGDQSTEPVRRAIAAGLFVNAARLTKEGHYVTVDSRVSARIHPSSVMFKTKPEMVVFTELVATGQAYIRDLTLVDPVWLAKTQPEYFRQHRIAFKQN